jgi:hypothetical protein
MHFEVPKSKTLKEFGGEYLMIVISILTALALENVIESVHHNHLAHEAEERIEKELRADTREIDEVLKHNEDKLRELISVRNQMLSTLRDKKSDAEWLRRFEDDWGKKIDMSLKSPGLRREAWETAVANQAVTWLERDKLERYATAYGNMRDVSSLLNGGAIPFLDGPRMRDVFSNVEMGMANPKDVFRMVNEMISAYSSYDSNLKNLHDELQAATTEHGGS